MSSYLGYKLYTPATNITCMAFKLISFPTTALSESGNKGKTHTAYTLSIAPLAVFSSIPLNTHGKIMSRYISNHHILEIGCTCSRDNPPTYRDHRHAL